MRLVPRRGWRWSQVRLFTLGARPPGAEGEDPATLVARRLSLAPPKDQWSQPWRYWALRYLAALAETADYEGTAFGPAQARVALETLHAECAAMVNELRRGR